MVQKCLRYLWPDHGRESPMGLVACGVTHLIAPYDSQRWRKMSLQQLLHRVGSDEWKLRLRGRRVMVDCMGMTPPDMAGVCNACSELSRLKDCAGVIFVLKNDSDEELGVALTPSCTRGGRRRGQD